MQLSSKYKLLKHEMKPKITLTIFHGPFYILKYFLNYLPVLSIRMACLPTQPLHDISNICHVPFHDTHEATNRWRTF